MPDHPIIPKARSVRAENAAAVLAVLQSIDGDVATTHAIATLCDPRRRSERAWHSGVSGSPLDDSEQLVRVAYLRRGHGTEMCIEVDVIVGRGGEWRIEASTAVWIRWDAAGEQDLLPPGTSCALLDEEVDDVRSLVDGWIEDAIDLEIDRRCGHG